MNREVIHIMLADDDADDRMLFEDAILATGISCQCVFFEDGIKLIDYLKDDSARLPDILFLDLNMPVKSGIECLKELRSYAHLKQLSIAIYSTSNAIRDIETTFTLGANVYLQKPSNFDKLTASLSHVLKMNFQFQQSGLNKETFYLNI